jgi:hypothetical protein
VIFPNGLRSRSIGTHSMASCHTMSIKSTYRALHRNDKWYSLECHETLLNYLKHFSNFLPLSLSLSRNDGTIHITKEKPTQRLESRAVCEQINKQTANETIMVVEQTTGW